MGKTVLRHPGRDRAEALLREGRLSKLEISKRCNASTEAVRLWARAMGIERIRATDPRGPRRAWQDEARGLLRSGIRQAEVARRCGVSVQSVSNLYWKMIAAGELQP